MGVDPSTERKFKALLQLITDPNQRVAATIQSELVGMGEVILPFLEDAKQSEPTLTARLTEVGKDIQFARVQEEFSALLDKGSEDFDLETGTFLLARSAYPNIDVGTYTHRLDELADGIRSRVHPALDVEHACEILSDYLFNEQGFQGNRDDYYDPDNSFLNRVLDRRMGIPVTLSVLYLFLGRRLGLPFAGVGMPGHFVVKVEGADPPLFIDCFNGGVSLRVRDCEQFLTDAGVGFDPSYLMKTPSFLILARMIRNLIGIYEKQQETGQVERLNSLMEKLEESPDGQ